MFVCVCKFTFIKSRACRSEVPRAFIWFIFMQVGRDGSDFFLRVSVLTCATCPFCLQFIPVHDASPCDKPAPRVYFQLGRTLRLRSRADR